MANFKNFTKEIQKQFATMCESKILFRVNISGTDLWKEYLNAFPENTDPKFRDPESTTHTCNNCNNFIRRYGNIVSINTEGNLVSIFGNITGLEEYSIVAHTLDLIITSSKIENVFFETFKELTSLPYEACKKNQDIFQLGIIKNIKRYNKTEAETFGVVKEDELKEFHHFNLQLPTLFVDKSGDSIESIMGKYRDKYSVFKRAMEEISLDTLNLVKDLINQGSLLDGTTHIHAIDEMIKYKEIHQGVEGEDNWFWYTTYSMNEITAKFKNHLIGVLCTELSEGQELNISCEKWNKRVDPANYHKATAPITQKQIEEAKKFVQENDFEESFNRRFATIDDIKTSEIKHINIGDGKIEGVSVFDNVKSTSTQHKRANFDKLEEVSIDKFISDILPNCTSLETYLKNSHEGNLVTLTTSVNENSKPIFKYSNNYSKTFNGNLTGKSQLKDKVTAKGGRVDGVFRYTHSWNELEPNQSLMDLHVFMPGNKHYDGKEHDNYGLGDRVGWNRRKDFRSNGTQDVDFTQRAPTGYIPVENITFPTLSKMPEGKYICKIHNWDFRTSGGKGKAEIEFNGNIYQYEYPKTKHKEWITIAEVTLKDGIFTIEHKLPETNSSKEIWGLDTEKFHKVNLVCLSPNHWENNKIGNLHYMFMLNKCKSDTAIRSFHNEDLIPELLKHRKVMEVLGATTMLEPTNKQLCGLGFNSTVKEELILKCSGNFNRMLKIKF